MTITATAFERSPDVGKGLARDTRVRRALEEAGQPYAVRLVSFAAMKQPAHLALHPFGQRPAPLMAPFAYSRVPESGTPYRCVVLLAVCRNRATDRG
jgi:hypothetical protein